MKDKLGILILEDSEHDLELFTRLLQRGFDGQSKIYSADSINTGLQIANTFPLDCVLIDYNLYGEDGIEFLEQFKTTEFFDEKPTGLIMVTGQGDEKIAVHAMKMGAHDYLIKETINNEILCHAIYQAIEKASLQFKLRGHQEELRQFLSITIHDLKTPLGILSSLTEMVSQQIPVKTEEVLETLDWMNKTLGKANETVNNLLEVVKAQDNDIPIPFSEISLEELFIEVQSEFVLEIEEHNVQINHDFSAKGEIFYSRMIAKTALHNLISNAIKYRSPDRVPKIDVTSGFVNDKLFISVKDNGLGIDLGKDRKALFSMFVRLHDHVEGTGIGLYLIKKMVERIGGEMVVESEVGKGSDFRIFI